MVISGNKRLMMLVLCVCLIFSVLKCQVAELGWARFKEEIAEKATSGNWACYNFIERRKDFAWIANKKFYYGKGEDNLGYVVCSDELE